MGLPGQKAECQGNPKDVVGTQHLQGCLAPPGGHAKQCTRGGQPGTSVANTQKNNDPGFASVS